MTRRRPSQDTTTSVHVPAPIGGINTIDVASEMPPTDAVSVVNMVASEQGLRSRLGYQEWCKNLTGSNSNQVRNIFGYKGSVSAENQLFAMTDNKIWSASASSSAPSSVFNFASASGDAGYGIARNITTSAGHFGVLCDEKNGYHVYTESTQTWAAVAMGGGATQVAGIDPATFVHVCPWKNRLWFTQRDTSKAWYLGAAFGTGGAIYGTATPFDFGGQFQNGGNLVGLWSWTIDGGSGIDDLLVAISEGGDVVIYKGTDPAAAATFGLVGRWYLGGVPVGRKIATDFGGDLLFLTTTGVIPLSSVVRGLAAEETSQYATAKIANTFNQLMVTYGALKGWSLQLHPTDNTLLLTYPVASGVATEQLAMSLWSKGWSIYRDLPIYSMGVWERQLYFGTTDGRVCINQGYIDNVALSDGSYSPVDFSYLTAFRALEGKTIQAKYTRTKMQSQSVSPEITIQVNYNFDTTEPAQPSSIPASGSSTWGTMVWGTGLWGGSYTPTILVRGAAGMGTDAAIAVRGNAVSRTIIMGHDVVGTVGGPL